MGCDIHLYFERLNKKGVWEKLDIPENLVPDNRNYDVFYFLAGVRGNNDNEMVPQFEHRGLPDNHSAGDDAEHNLNLGEHNFTYAYLDEILSAPWQEAGLRDCYFYIFCVYVFPRLIDGYLTMEEKRGIRILMGFDS